MFERIRTINGHQYRYQETRWRVGKKVKSRSIYLGKVDKAHDEAMDKAWKAADRAIAKVEKEQRAKYGMTNEERANQKSAAPKEDGTDAKPDASKE